MMMDRLRGGWLIFLLLLGAGIGGAVGWKTAVSKPQPTSLTYQLTWQEDGITLNEQGWTMINDLGYTVNLEQGYIASLSLELIPCESASEEAGWWSVPIAYAGHGESEADPSLWLGPYVEVLTAVESVTFGKIWLDEVDYCGAHYLVAQAGETAVNLPKTVGMARYSVYLEGNYVAQGSDEAIPFLIASPLAWGAQSEFDEAMIIGGDVTVVVERPLSSLFNGVDFEMMAEQTQAMAVLRSLMNETAVYVERKSE